MSVNLSPIGNGINFLGTTGLPLAGGQLYTYQAGSSTALTTYQDYSGLVPNTNPIVLGTDGRLPAELWLSAGFNYKFVLRDANNYLIATYDNIYGILGTIPATSSPFTAGMILLWSGAIGSVPSGWNLCDGTNGSPDLRDRFIVGAGNSYSVNQIGGSADATLVAHSHTATSTSSSSSSVSDPGHTHQLPYGNDLYGTSTGSGLAGYSPPVRDNTYSATTGITVATSTSTSTSIASAGTSATNANLPPYYALAYIYKL